MTRKFEVMLTIYRTSIHLHTSVHIKMLNL